MEDAGAGGPSASSPKEEPNPKPVVHRGVTCDVCRRSPIVGMRFKHLKRANYDVCETCYHDDGITPEPERADYQEVREAEAIVYYDVDPNPTPEV